MLAAIVLALRIWKNRRAYFSNSAWFTDDLRVWVR